MPLRKNSQYFNQLKVEVKLVVYFINMLHNWLPDIFIMGGVYFFFNSFPTLLKDTVFKVTLHLHKPFVTWHKPT